MQVDLEASGAPILNLKDIMDLDQLIAAASTGRALNPAAVQAALQSAFAQIVGTAGDPTSLTEKLLALARTHASIFHESGVFSLLLQLLSYAPQDKRRSAPQGQSYDSLPLLFYAWTS